MEPISIGIAVGTGLISSFTKKLLEKAADPETVAKSINWVFSAADNFLKVRKKERAKDTSISPPPAAGTQALGTEPISNQVAEQKAIAAEEIVKSANQPNHTANEGGVKLIALDDFAVEQLVIEITSLMKQIETYLNTLRFEEEKAALHGGVQFAPPVVMHTIRIQQEEIVKRVLRLNQCMQKAYGTSAPNLNTLLEVVQPG